MGLWKQYMGLGLKHHIYLIRGNNESHRNIRNDGK